MSTVPRSHHAPTRMHSAVLAPIGLEGRATLVEQRLGQAIAGGILRSGERLPSESDLARTLRVSPVTVREALGTLRARGLITTRRGRHGGSFVTSAADPAEFARRRLRETTRLALRDLGLHYLVIGSSCVGLAAERAHPAEVEAIRRRLRRDPDAGADHWRRHYDEVLLELAALSQSARLTREQMMLQAELSPLLALLKNRQQEFTALEGVLDAVGLAEPELAQDRFREIARSNTAELVLLHEQMHVAQEATDEGTWDAVPAVQVPAVSPEPTRDGAADER